MSVFSETRYIFALKKILWFCLKTVIILLLWAENQISPIEAGSCYHSTIE